MAHNFHLDFVLLGLSGGHFSGCVINLCEIEVPLIQIEVIHIPASLGIELLRIAVQLPNA